MSEPTKLNKETNEVPTDFELLRKKLFKMIKMYDENQKDLIGRYPLFCDLVVDYCKQARHGNSSLPVPKVFFRDLKHGFAYYTSAKNCIVIDKGLVNKVESGDKSIVLLIETIGHEMMHYSQNSNLYEYEKMSIREQRQVDEQLKESVDAYMNYHRLTKEDLKVLKAISAPFVGEDIVPEGYKTQEEYFEEISSATYFTLKSELEAREEGVDFALSLFKCFEKIGNKPSQSLKFNFMNLKYSRAFDRKEYEKLQREYDDFSENFNADEEMLLKIVKKVESKSDKLKKFNSRNYLSALNFLIKDKSLEQKKTLLQNAIFNGYNYFADVLIDSIQNSLEYKENRKEISSFVRDCLMGSAYGYKKLVLPYKSFYSDFSSILTQEDFEKVVVETLKISSYNATSLLHGRNVRTFSPEALLVCQKCLFKTKQKKEELEKTAPKLIPIDSEEALQRAILEIEEVKIKMAINKNLSAGKTNLQEKDISISEKAKIVLRSGSNKILNLLKEIKEREESDKEFFIQLFDMVSLKDLERYKKVKLDERVKKLLKRSLFRKYRALEEFESQCKE